MTTGPNRHFAPATLLDPATPQSRLLQFLCLVALVFLVYANTLDAPFYLDDNDSITTNQAIRMTEPSLEQLTRAAAESPVAYRPLAYISFALNYYFGGYATRGYRLVNILIHGLAGIILYLVAAATLRTPALAATTDRSYWVPFFSTLLWLIHPLQIQSVTYIVQRMNSMAALFYLLALLCYIHGRTAPTTKRRWLLYGGSLFAGLLALASKPNAAMLPAAIILYEWFFFQDLDRNWLRRRLLPLAGFCLLMLLLAFVYLGSQPIEHLLAGYQQRQFTMGQRLLTESRVLFAYLGLLLYPHPDRLTLLHDFPVSTGLTQPVTTLISLCGLVLILLTAAILARRHRFAAFAVFWFFGNHLIESSFIGLEIFFEHRNYLPSMFLVVAGVATVFRRTDTMTSRLVLLLPLAAVLAFWTHERNRVWSDEIAFWEDTISKYPLATRAHNDLAVAVLAAGDEKRAILEFNEAIRVNYRNVKAHYNLALLLSKRWELDKARMHLQEALRLNPEFKQAREVLQKIDRMIAAREQRKRTRPPP